MDGSGRYTPPALKSGAVHFFDLDEGDDLAGLPLGEVAEGAVVATIQPGQLRALAARLREAGIASTTTMLVVTDAGQARQESYKTTLADPVLPGVAGLDRRVVVVIGDIVTAPRRLTLADAERDYGTGFSMAGLAG
jgi:siroheme synthase